MIEDKALAISMPRSHCLARAWLGPARAVLSDHLGDSAGLLRSVSRGGNQRVRVLGMADRHGGNRRRGCDSTTALATEADSSSVAGATDWTLVDAMPDSLGGRDQRP